MNMREPRSKKRKSIEFLDLFIENMDNKLPTTL